MLILVAGVATVVFPFSPEEAQGYFEWGEYEQLIHYLEPYLADSAAMLDSVECAQYYLYLGVAQYSVGNISVARNCFLKALRVDRRQRLDRQYISDEIDGFFFATLNDYTDQLRRARENDSLFALRQRAFDENVRAIRHEEVHRNRVTGTILCISGLVIGAGFAGVAAYEYNATKEPYADFRRAANRGDRVNYDRLQPIIRRANGIIIGCVIAAGASEVAGSFFGIRLWRIAGEKR